MDDNDVTGKIKVGDKVRLVDSYFEEGIVTGVTPRGVEITGVANRAYPVQRLFKVNDTNMSRSWEILESAPKWKDGDVAEIKDPSYRTPDPAENLRYRIGGEWKMRNGARASLDNDFADKFYTLIIRDGKVV